MDSRDKSRRLLLFLEWDIDKDEKIWNFRSKWTLVTNLDDYFFSLEWDIDEDAKSEISGPNGL